MFILIVNCYQLNQKENDLEQVCPTGGLQAACDPHDLLCDPPNYYENTIYLIKSDFFFFLFKT